MDLQLRQAASGDTKAATQSWLLIVLETWLREYNVEIGTDPRMQPRAALVNP